MTPFMIAWASLHGPRACMHSQPPLPLWYVLRCLHLCSFLPQGHITSLTWFDYEDASCAGCFVSGGQDGCVRVWDPRGRSCVAKLELHVNDAGRGAVGDLAAGASLPGCLPFCLSACYANQTNGWLIWPLYRVYG